MEYTTLGGTGTTVPKLCFGTWRFSGRSGGTVETDREETHALLDAAHERGVSFFDTANRYGDPPGTSEEYLGEWLDDRDKFVVATKVGLPVADGVNDAGLSRRHVRRQIEASLDQLRSDYVDLYYIHRLDPSAPLKETLSVFTELVEDGRVHYLGASTMAAWQLATLYLTAEVNDFVGIDVVQQPVDATLHNWKHYEGFDLSQYLDVCANQDLGGYPYSPPSRVDSSPANERLSENPTDVAGPDGSRANLLSKKFERKYLAASAWDVLAELQALSDELRATPAQIALRWVMEQDVSGGMIPIVGARTPEQLTENVAATGVDLDVAHLDRIDSARGERLLIDPWPGP